MLLRACACMALLWRYYGITMALLWRYYGITGKYKECSKLPELVNGRTECRNLTAGRICDLSCNEGYEFTTSEDHTPQQCIDGQWTYQRSPLPVAYPTCEGEVAQVCMHVHVHLSVHAKLSDWIYACMCMCT